MHHVRVTIVEVMPVGAIGLATSPCTAKASWVQNQSGPEQRKFTHDYNACCWQAVSLVRTMGQAQTEHSAIRNAVVLL